MQFVIDSKDGFFREYLVHPAGLDNDQGMMLRSPWNEHNALVNDTQCLIGDGGYHNTEHINILRPWDAEQRAGNAVRIAFNRELSVDRGLIELGFGIFKETFPIFDVPWRRDIALFELTLRVSMKMMNFFWADSADGPPGSIRQSKGYLDGYYN